MQEKRELPGALKTLAGVVIVFLLLATGYVIYQAGQVLFPPNTYETALLATVEDTVDAEGVLLFDESYVAGDGTLGYLVADGERVSAGTAVAEVYSDASQAALRQQLTQLGDQIDLLQKSQNTTSAQMYRPSLALRPRSRPRRPAISSARPAPAASMRGWRISLLSARWT